MADLNIDEIRDEIRDALEGDSNDAEHDALAMVAEVLGIEWRSPYADDDGNYDPSEPGVPGNDDDRHAEPSPDPNWMNP
jgi:hypothetical protein